MKSAVILTIGIVAALIGVGGVLSAIFLPGYIHDQKIEGVKDFLIVDSVNASNFDDWKNNWNENATPEYKYFYLYNITNPNEVLTAAAKPVVEELGPYKYQRLLDKIDPVFFDDGEKVQYVEWERHVFVGTPEEEAAMKEGVVYNFKPDTLAALNNDKGGDVPLMMQLLAADQLPGVKFYDVIPMLVKVEALVQAPADDAFDLILMMTQFNDTTGAGEYIDAIFRGPKGFGNESAMFDLWFPTMYLPTDSDEYKGAEVLVKKFFPELFDTKKTKGMTGMRTWFAKLWNFPMFEQVIVSNLQGAGSADVKDFADVLPYQWGTCNVTLNDAAPVLSIAEAAPTLFSSNPDATVPDAYPEFYAFTKTIGRPKTLDIELSRRLLNASDSRSLVANIPQFAVLGPAKDYAGLAKILDVDQDTAELLTLYMQYLGHGLVGGQLGLMLELTPFDMIWNSGINYNVSTVEECRQDAATTMINCGPSVYYTGKNNIDHVAEYIEWFNQTAVEHVWGSPEHVRGTTGFNFETGFDGFNETGEFDIWFDTVKRVVYLEVAGDGDVYGIKTKRLVLRHDLFDPNPNYYLYKWHGFANLTNFMSQYVAELDAMVYPPAYMTQPHFYQVGPENVTNTVCLLNYLREHNTTCEESPGLHPTEDHRVELDVEPFSGATVVGHKRLQFNFYSQPTPFVCADCPTAMVPFFWVDQFSEVSEKDAGDLKDGLYGADKISDTVQYAGYIGGGCLVAVGALVVGLGMRKRRSVDSDAPESKYLLHA